MSRKTDASSPSGGIRVAVGTYTGDGAATQAIVGVGFRPKFVIVYGRESIPPMGMPQAFKADVDPADRGLLFTSGDGIWLYMGDEIVSLDVDGFTVGDGTPRGANQLNAAGYDYTYWCMR